MPQKAASKKPVLAVDFDDTIVLNAQSVIETYNREHKGKIRLENIYVDDAIGNKKHGWNHGPDEAIAWINKHLSSPEVLKNRPLPGAREALERLQGKYEIAIVTGRPPAIEHLVKQWLERHMPGLVINHIYHTGWTSKSEVCRDIDAQVMIDDSPMYIHDCHKAGIEVIVFGDYPWNTPDRLPEKAPRAKDWSEVEEILL